MPIWVAEVKLRPALRGGAVLALKRRFKNLKVSFFDFQISQCQAHAPLLHGLIDNTRDIIWHYLMSVIHLDTTSCGYHISSEIELKGWKARLTSTHLKIDYISDSVHRHRYPSQLTKMTKNSLLTSGTKKQLPAVLAEITGWFNL